MSAGSRLEAGVPHVLREYALLADGERGALVGPRGDFAWLCFPAGTATPSSPRWSAARGAYSVTPARALRLGRLLRARHADLAQPLGHRRRRSSSAARRSRCPARPERARASCAASVAVRAGTRSRSILDLRARTSAQGVRRCAASTTAAGRPAPAAAPLDAAPAATPRRTRADACCGSRSSSAAASTTTSCSCSPRRRRAAEPPTRPSAWAATEAGVARAGARRSRTRSRRATPGTPTPCSRGLTSAGGGMVAAATTSLPERAGQGRNYDYRYVWIRDQCYAGQAVARRRPHPLLDDAVRFVAARLLERRPAICSPPTRPTAAACPTSASSTCPATPAATTSSATGSTTQFQLDAFGEALLLFAAAAAATTGSTPTAGARPRSRPTRSRRAGSEPDAGIWELDARRLDAQPADLRRRAARDRAPRHRAAQRPRAGSRSPTRIVADDRRRRACTRRALAARARRRAGRRGAAAARDPRRGARRRPALARDAAARSSAS